MIVQKTYMLLLAFVILFLVYWIYRLRREVKCHVRLEKHEERHKMILEMVAKSEPLEKVLDAIVQSVEKQNKGAMCSVILIDTQKLEITKVIAPSLPAFYNEAIVGLKIEQGSGSCGTAITTKERVIVEEIATHPYWSVFKELAHKAELGACWSEPILSSQNVVLGTFEIYHKATYKPTDSDVSLIKQSAYLASIAIEKDKTEINLRKSEAHYRTLTENISDVIWEVDSNFMITYISPSDKRLRGFEAEEIVGHSVFEMFTQEGKKNLIEQISKRQELEASGEKVEIVCFEMEHVCKDGSLKWGEVLARPIRDEAQKIIGYHGATREMTERKVMQEQVNQLAFYDALTGLPNRLLLKESFLHACEVSKRNKKYSAMMFLDLDNFKSINDIHGHTMGDLLLIEAARRLKENVRSMDTVARFGGDEFVIILKGLHEDKMSSKKMAEAVADKIRLILSEVYCLKQESKEAELNEIQHYCTVSIGIALMYHGENISYDEMLIKTDTAMYKAKEAGKNTILFDE